MRGECDAILDRGLKDTAEFKSFEALRNFVSTALQWDYATFIEKRNESRGRGGFALFDAFRVGTGGALIFEDLKESYGDNPHGLFKRDEFINYIASQLNVTIINAWRKCLASESGCVGYYFGDPINDFTVALTYLATATSGQAALQISRVSFPDCEERTSASSSALPPFPTDPAADLASAMLRPGETKVWELHRTHTTKESEVAIELNDGTRIVIPLPATDMDQRLAKIENRLDRVEASTIASDMGHWATYAEPNRTSFKQHMGLDSKIKGPHGEREFKTDPVMFKTSFKKLPTVLLSIENLDAAGGARYFLFADDITTRSFRIRFSTWGDTEFHNISVRWLALGL